MHAFSQIGYDNFKQSTCLRSTSAVLFVSTMGFESRSPDSHPT